MRAHAAGILHAAVVPLVIDTGMAAGDIRTVIEKLTPRPYALALTHGHGDHCWHAGVFDKIYRSMADKDLLLTARFPGQQMPAWQLSMVAGVLY